MHLALARNGVSVRYCENYAGVPYWGRRKYKWQVENQHQRKIKRSRPQAA